MLIRGGAFDEAASLGQPLHHAENTEARHAEAHHLASARQARWPRLRRRLSVPRLRSALRGRHPPREKRERFGSARGTLLRLVYFLAVKTEPGESKLHSVMKARRCSCNADACAVYRLRCSPAL